jgi:hypothetical protein
MEKAEANALMRAKFGPLWFEVPGNKAQRDALVRGTALRLTLGE